MRLLLSGYYGCGNAGDESVLEGALTALRRAGRVETTVLSGDPEATRALHGVQAVSRGDPRAIWRALGLADLLISGGGGLIQDRTSARSSLYYLGIIEMAQRAGVPVYLYSQGVGPLRRRWLRRVVGHSLRRVKGAGVRDEASGKLLEEIGVPGELITVTADAAFALRPPGPEESRKALAAIGVDAGQARLIGVVWRRPISERVAGRRGEHAAGRGGVWVGARGAEHVSAQGGGRNDGRGGARGIVGDGVDPEAFRRAAGAAVGHFARRLGAKVVVLPFHPALDRSEAYEFARVTSQAGAESVVFDPCDGESGDAAESDTNRGRTWGRGRGETGQVDHRRLLALVGGMDLLLCVRFHGLVFSALSGRPAVAVAYDPKVHHLAESLGVPWLVPGVDSSLLTQALVEAWEQRETLSKALFERAEEFRTRAFAEGVRALACAKGQGGAGRV